MGKINTNAMLKLIKLLVRPHFPNAIYYVISRTAVVNIQELLLVVVFWDLYCDFIFKLYVNNIHSS